MKLKGLPFIFVIVLIFLVSTVPLVSAKTAAEWYSEGLNYGSQGKYSDEIRAYDQALALDPTFVKALYNKGRALDDLNKLNDAIATYEKVLALDPDHADALYNLAYDFNEQGRYQEALATYEKVIQIEPNAHDAWSNKGYSLYFLGRYQEAVDAADRALAIKPGYQEAIQVKTRAQAKIKSSPEASLMTTPSIGKPVGTTQVDTNTKAASPPTTKAAPLAIAPVLSGVIGALWASTRKYPFVKAADEV